MTAPDGARRDAAVLALVQAKARLDHVTRVLTRRARWSPTARRLLAVLDVVRPIIVALDHVLPEPK